jgi:carboxyl-terminal processing protease
VPDIVLPSIEDFLPIGEADLPRALVWDQISPSRFTGSPLDPKILTPLLQSSLERQSELEEFAYLRKYVDWFKSRQEQKLISVNLERRQQQKAADDLFRKEMKSEKDRLAQQDYTYKPFYLGPPPAPKIRAPKDDDDEFQLDDSDDAHAYAKADVHLRESLRVVADAIALAKNRELWASNRPPLTAASGG